MNILLDNLGIIPMKRKLEEIAQNGLATYIRD